MLAQPMSHRAAYAYAYAYAYVMPMVLPSGCLCACLLRMPFVVAGRWFRVGAIGFPVVVCVAVCVLGFPLGDRVLPLAPLGSAERCFVWLSSGIAYAICIWLWCRAYAYVFVIWCADAYGIAIGIMPMVFPVGLRPCLCMIAQPLTMHMVLPSGLPMRMPLLMPFVMARRWGLRVGPVWGSLVVVCVVACVWVPVGRPCVVPLGSPPVVPLGPRPLSRWVPARCLVGFGRWRRWPDDDRADDAPAY